MFRYILTKIKVLSHIFQSDAKKQSKSITRHQIPAKIEEANAFLGKKFENCSNFYKSIYTLGDKKALLVYMNGFISAERLELGVMEPLLALPRQQNKEISFDIIKSHILPTQVLKIDCMEKAIDYLYYGYVILFLENESSVLAINISETEKQNISKAEIEHSIRGPKEGLSENSLLNLFLLTNRIKNPDFKSEMLTLGERTKTHVYLCYLKGVAKEEIVEQVKERVEKIEIDGLLDVNFVNEYISDNPLTFFPLAGIHERPDTIAAQVLEGRVAIICDGSPFAITVPHLFIEDLQNSEDYFNRPIFGTFVRILRFFSFAFATLLPALYIAFLNFEHHVTPFTLLITAAAGQEKIPFPSIVEALLMVLSFEVLKEATIRMPKGIGQTISIVGALVLGEAAVKAGFTSNLIVIILAMTAICSYVNTNLIDAISLYRLGYIVAANIYGLAGIVFLTAFICVQMCSLTSFGVPYMSPLSPINGQGLKDSLFRFPLKSMTFRPLGMAQDGQRRGREK